MYKTPPSLSSQPLWEMCPATPKASPTWPRWTPTCPSMSARPCASLPVSCRLFHSVQVCGAPWSTSPRCAPYSLSAPGCCTALAKLLETWCSRCWQKRSRTSGCSATLQVRRFPHCGGKKELWSSHMGHCKRHYLLWSDYDYDCGMESLSSVLNQDLWTQLCRRRPDLQQLIP